MNCNYQNKKKRNIVNAAFLSARPTQWTKNLIIYAALFFTLGETWALENSQEVLRLVARTTIGFIIFSGATSSIYIFNDVLDAEKDRNHPNKKNRPIAAGDINTKPALAGALFAAIAALGGGYFLELHYGLIVSLYLLVMIGYSVFLKNIIIVDVMTISSGFVMRAAAGAVVIGATISPWLYICTGLGALFIGFAKRLNEKNVAGESGFLQRRTLEEYSTEFLGQLISIVGTSTLVSYTLYTFTANNLPDNNAMMLSIPFVAYGLFRYIYLVQNKDLGEVPEQILFKDAPLALTILSWLATTLTILLFYK